VTSVGDVVAQLRDVINRIDGAAVAATHAEADIRQAQGFYAEAKQGANDPDLNNAETEVREAGDKAGKIARLLAEASTHFAAYLNTIAPGTVSLDVPSQSVAPSGEQLLDQAAERARRAERAWRKQVESADNIKDGLEKAESGGKAVFNYYKQLQKPPGGTADSVRPVEEPQLRPAPDPLHIDNPITAAIMAAAAVAVAAKSVWDDFRARRLNGRESDDET
jgi:hypothetical protein